MFSALFVTCAACYLSNVLGYALVHGFAGPALTAEEKQQIEREANKQENAFIWLTVAGLAYMATGEKEIKYVLPLTLMYVSF